MNEANTPVWPSIKEIKLTEKDIARFWTKVDKNGPTMPHMDSQCWVWVAAKDRKGYGSFGAKGKKFRSHRVAWVQVNGSIPNDLHVLHSCDFPSCCNISHLWVGTNMDNVVDRVNKGRNNTPHGDKNGRRTCPGSTIRGEKHWSSKLTAAQIIEIRSIYAIEGTMHSKLADIFGVTRETIRDIINRRIWRHI